MAQSLIGKTIARAGYPAYDEYGESTNRSLFGGTE